jgi:hypothetical protein
MWRIYILMSIVMLILGSIGYWYYNDSQKRIKALQESNAVLTLVAETNDQTIKALVEQQRINGERLLELSNNLSVAEAYNTELRNILQRHNLTRLAEQRPGLIEKRINDATIEVFNAITTSTSTR